MNRLKAILVLLNIEFQQFRDLHFGGNIEKYKL